MVTCRVRNGVMNDVKNNKSEESPTSVLEDEDTYREKGKVKTKEELLTDVKTEECISKSMAEEEEKLLEARIKEEEKDCKQEPVEAANLNDTQFTKLDELLTQTQLYTEFMLEKMDDITFNGDEQEAEPTEKKRGRGSKRKAASQ